MDTLVTARFINPAQIVQSMREDKHYERLKESLEVLDESITKGIMSRQRTIGFNCSAAAVDMLEIYLHKVIRNRFSDSAGMDAAETNPND